MSYGRAVVIGASMGGLLAARALADFFEDVLVVERDALSPSEEHRKGVPQSRHTHGLLLQGHALLEGFFPGLTDELVREGVPLARAEDLVWFDGGGYHAPFTSEHRGALLASRPRLELYVRARVSSLPNVRIRDRCDVLGLVASPSAARIEGVRILARRAGSAEETLSADLVVDASGRGSRTPAWLEGLGYRRPEEETITVRFGYTTRLFRRRPEHLGGIKVVIVTTSPETRRGAVLLAQEDDRWTLSLAGFAGDYPPLDDEGILRFAESLPAREIAELVRIAEPLSDPIPYRFPASLRRRYETLRTFPEGLVVFADALCSFNPVYGQGMSVAAMEALELQRCLRKGLNDLAPRFFASAARCVDRAWQIVATADLQFPEVEGRRTPALRAVQSYLRRLHRAARHDPVVARAFNEVVGLVAPPESLLRPPIAARVLRRGVLAGVVRRPGAPAGPLAEPPAPWIGRVRVDRLARGEAPRRGPREERDAPDPAPRRRGERHRKE